jgi:hypothetical protein
LYKYEIFANAFKNSKLDHKYVRINYLSKYSKYAEGLLRHMSRSYIHRSLPCEALLLSQVAEIAK